LAKERGWTFNWRKIEIQSPGHNAKFMLAAPECENALFGDSRMAGQASFSKLTTMLESGRAPEFVLSDSPE